MKKPLHMLTGVNIGDYEFNPDTILDVVKKFKFGKENGDLFHFLSIRMDMTRPTSEQLYQWAEYFRENDIHFDIHGIHPRYGELKIALTKEEVENIQQIAGDYFVGAGLSEFGGFYATRAKGYTHRPTEHPIQGMKDCVDAKRVYIREVQKIINKIKESGIAQITSIQAVALTPYDYEAGVDVGILEVAPRNMEQVLSFGRGAARAYKKEVLGAWLAHEFYGGYHQFDPLKAKRFTAEYYAMYLAGIDFMCLESGYREIHSHVDAVLPGDHPLPQSYLKEASNFAEFCNGDIRPGKDGPITKIAFVQGNLDGYAFGNSSSLWGQYFDEKWGFGAPEFSYRVLDDVYTSAGWFEGRNFGDYDYSHAPAYGQYDVIPATTPLEVMQRYEWVIFCGWNTMTPEIYETLKAYVAGGGNLYITAAHMRDSIDRAEKGKFLDVNWEELLGVQLTEETFRCNDGYKFVKESTIAGVMYPGTKTLMCDPAWSAGYTNYVKMQPSTAKPVCFISDAFMSNTKGNPMNGYECFADVFADQSIIPIITEHQYGKGNVIFMANDEYPGAPEIFPLYRQIVKQILCASHRTSDLKVIGSDKLRFAMYEGETLYKLYIFNTDYNVEQKVKVFFKDQAVEKTIDSVGLAIIEFPK